MDIDVNGALRVKDKLGDRAISIFIQPPSIDELRRRLESRATDSPESIDARIDRAKYELDQAPRFDARIINDDLERAVADARRVILDFLNK